MNLFGPSPAQLESRALQDANDARVADIESSLRRRTVPTQTRQRLDGARTSLLPWTATLTPAELMIVRSHGLRPIAAVSATCWMHHGRSWTEGHAQGWETALRRLREEARACGANAVLDVKMRTLPFDLPNSEDFTLTGTAVSVEGLDPADHPLVATVPALEFVKLLEADVIPTGLAIGAQFDWLTDWRNTARQTWMGNIESTTLSQFWESIRRKAHAELRRSAQAQGNGVLAHVNFSQMFEFENDNQPTRYLGRHIVIGTTVDAARATAIPHEIGMVVDMQAGVTPLTGTSAHHQSYAANQEKEAI